jgi:hypothetical protein
VALSAGAAAPSGGGGSRTSVMLCLDLNTFKSHTLSVIVSMTLTKRPY